MVLTEEEIAAIKALIDSVNLQINEIADAREDVRALLRIAGSIDSDQIEDQILSDSKQRAKTAAQAIVDLL